ncbi:energy transducer TonB [Rhodanobacter sp. 115]|uniref:energy transducer TonB n=1 Tax=Rhodanobacter sp. FW021-MT20 TaxID=1162282 RepID=UPI000260C96D|nr:energy transducer TonB [Rhodanobacter sp. 115]EIM03797.1 TonB family protein [Rhodanobacter sp. 115]
MNTTSRRLCQSLLLASAVLCTLPVLAQEARKVGPQQLYNYWIRLNTKVQVNMPNSGKNLLKPGCVAVSYLIGSDGVPLHVKVQKVVPASDLGPAAASAVTNFRYGPSLSNRSHNPVATYYVVPFNSPDDKAARDKLMAPCALPGYNQG